MTTELELRNEICRIGRSLFDRGYVHGTAGNISVRFSAGYLITPTEACLGFLEAGKLAHMASDGTQLRGARASKTFALHRKIYDSDETASCVIHTHSRNLVALSLLGVWSLDDIVPPITPYYVMKVGHVPLIAYHRPGDTAVCELVAEKIQTMRAKRLPIRAIMIDRLGPNVWHTTPAAAMATLEELEETAYLWRTANLIPCHSRPTKSMLCERVLAPPGRSNVTCSVQAKAGYLGKVNVIHRAVIELAPPGSLAENEEQERSDASD